MNCGSAVGDTIFWYFANGLKAKKVYAYEGSANTYSALCSNLKYLPSDYRYVVQPINEYISVDTAFEEKITEKITLLNADIEGNELSMLKAMEDVIIKDRPVLAICAYHKKEDLLELPLYISSIVEDYRFFLRKYEGTPWCGSNYFELVLYAIPVERCC